MTETTFDFIAAQAAARARKGKKNGKKRCKQQEGQCASSLVSFCADRPIPGACLDQLGPCCEFFKTCDAATAVDCLFSTPK